MKLTSFTDYTLRVRLYLATEPERGATVAEVADAFAINVNHLTKVANLPGQQGWVHTVRGNGGGVELAVPPESAGIGEVVRRSEGADLPAERFDRATNRCHIARACQLRGVLAEAVRAFRAVLDRYTLADVVNNRAVLIPLLRA